MSDYVAAHCVLITGANRGLGLEIVKLILRSSQLPKHLICVCRDPSGAAELQSLASQHEIVSILQLDISQYDRHEAFAEAVEGIVREDGLNLFINCATRFPKDPQTLESTTAQGLTDSFSVNAVAPFLLTKELLPLLRRAASASRGAGGAGSLSSSRAAVIHMSAHMASIALTTSSYGYMFRASKAALNMLTKCLSIDLSRDGILVAAIHPGWVQTDAGGTIALDQEQGAGMVLAAIGHLTADDNGKFLNYKGEAIPW